MQTIYAHVQIVLACAGKLHGREREHRFTAHGQRLLLEPRFWVDRGEIQASTDGMRRALATEQSSQEPAMRYEEGFETESESTADASPRVARAARKVTEGIGELGRALSDRRQGVVEPMADFIQERPLAALGVAFGIGYILGGGLFSRTTGRVLALGWRLGGMALAKNMLSGLAGTGQEL